MDLPFELRKDHKKRKKSNWKEIGLIMDNFEEIYKRYIYCKNCELCDKVFTKTIDRHMDHNHETGEFRNIVCNRCNQLKSDRKENVNNTSGYKHIHKHINTTCKKGFTWVFQVQINGKNKLSKSSIDLDKLIEFRDKWLIENNYHT